MAIDQDPEKAEHLAEKSSVLADAVWEGGMKKLPPWPESPVEEAAAIVQALVLASIAKSLVALVKTRVR